MTIPTGRGGAGDKLKAELARNPASRTAGKAALRA